MRIVHTPRYQIDIGPHIFPTAKYQLVRDRLLKGGWILSHDVVEPAEAPWDDLALVHTAEYLEKIRTGTFSIAELAQLELPWSPSIVEGFRLMTGGTQLAARLALEEGVTAHIGGGFHHAFANHGEGFCLFNDVAVAVRTVQRDHGVARAAIIDCDVHHGNGTAMIFERDPSVFTFSMHQQHNYPSFKPRSDLDVGLPDNVQDGPYLARLEEALPRVFETRPEIAVYLAGADPYGDDQLGGLGLTKEGLRRRDRLVIQRAAAAGVPLVVTLAGGYARRLDDTVSIHVGTIEEAHDASLHWKRGAEAG